MRWYGGRIVSPDLRCHFVVSCYSYEHITTSIALSAKKKVGFGWGRSWNMHTLSLTSMFDVAGQVRVGVGWRRMFTFLHHELDFHV